MSKSETLPHLRFILRDGEKVLQQAHFVTKSWCQRGYEWRDVPLITNFIDKPTEERCT